MAEALAKKILEEMGQSESVKVVSAGTSAVEGCPATSEAIQVMANRGIDLTSHASQPLTMDLAREADLILTMTEQQKKFVLNLLPSSYGRVHTLKDYILEGLRGEGDLEELAGYLNRLDEKEHQFYSQYGDEIERLKTEYNDHANKLREIEAQLLAIEEQFAQHTREEREKIALLERGKKLEIADPYGQDIGVYESCAEELEDNVGKAIMRFFSEIE